MSASGEGPDVAGRAAVRAEVCPRISVDTPEFTERFYETFAEVREKSSIAWDTTHQHPFVVGYDEICRAARSWQAFSSAGAVTDRPDAGFRLLPIECDPPLHTEWRRIINPWFTSTAVKQYDGLIGEVVHDLIDRFAATGAFDGVSDFARPIPQRVLFEQVMGLPAEDVQRCGQYVETFFGDDIEERLKGTQQLGDYTVELIRRYRGVPAAPNLVSEIAHARIDGAEPSVVDASSVIMTLIIGTLDTTEKTIASCLLHLATHPAHWDLLASDLQQLPRAVEEFLRLYTPAASAMRHARGAQELGGISIADGSVVALGYAAGSRDPVVFESPGEFLVDRQTNRHLGFGVGPHYCPGAYLARAMIRNALQAVVTRLADLRVAPGHEVRFKVAGTRGLGRIDLVFRDITGTGTQFGGQDARHDNRAG